MNLLSNLRTAKYNNVSFQVTTSSVQFGRRNQVHEYPQRDEPYIEDLGRAKREFTITGFLIGDDYITQTKNLVKALETEGTGTLVHPWLGKLNVNVNDQAKVTWSLEQGYSTVEVSFTEQGKKDTASTSSYGDALRQEADDLANSACSAFGVSFEELQGDVTAITELATDTYAGILETISDSQFASLFNIGSSIADLGSSAIETFNNGADSITSSFMSAVGIAQFTNKLHNYRETSRSAMSVVSSSTFNQGASAEDSSKTTTNLDNASTALTTFSRQIMVSNLVGAVSMIGTGNDSDDGSSSTAVTQSADDIIDIRNNVLNILEQEMLYAKEDDSDVYETLEGMYSSVYQYLTNEVLKDVDLVSYDNKNTKPALVLAYELYEDADRADEIVKRNNIVNPLFVAPSKLLVLDE